MPKFDVSLTVSASHRYVITVSAKDADTAGDNVLAQFRKLRARHAPLPWNETDCSEDAAVDDVMELTL